MASGLPTALPRPPPPPRFSPACPPPNSRSTTGLSTALWLMTTALGGPTLPAPPAGANLTDEQKAHGDASSGRSPSLATPSAALEDGREIDLLGGSGRAQDGGSP